MKSTIITILFIIVVALTANAEKTLTDSMFIHTPNGIIIVALDKIDSIVYYAPDIPLDEFSSPNGTFVDDRDHREYKWVRIGSQVWMAENLAYLPQVHDIYSIQNATGPCYSVNGYDGTDTTIAKMHHNYNTSGVLYNLYAVNQTGSSSICPSGWHVSTTQEWSTLYNYVTTYSNGSEGDAIKATTGWGDDGTTVSGSDTYGFSALPGGLAINWDDDFYPAFDAFWWTYNTSSTSVYWYLYGTSDNTFEQQTSFDPKKCLNVRCVKD